MMNNEIMIYDFYVYLCYDDEVRETISKLFYCTDDTHVSLAPMHKQDAASNNCGVFAIAAATAIASSCNPLLSILNKRKCENISVIALKMVP